MPTAVIDKVWSGIHFTLIDGKFYSLFSLLFGIGFSIILSRAAGKGKNGLVIFYRRIFVLLLIGLAHLLLLWEGDIVMLYALIGLILPLFRNLKNRTLLLLSAVLILVPVFMDLLKVLSNNEWNISNWLKPIGKKMDENLGITETNFSTWLVEHRSYKDLLAYNQSGIIYRYQMLLDNNRFFKVLGLFLLGLYVGRNRLYAGLEESRSLLKKIRNYGFLIGLPLSVLLAYLQLNGKGLPHWQGWISTWTYALSVVPLSLAFVAAICLLYLKNPKRKMLRLFQAPGRMALTNYIAQTIIGIFIFYGIGAGLGADIGVIYVVGIAIAVYFILLLFSHVWLYYFNYGPLEWVWRILTYGQWLPLKRSPRQAPDETEK